MKTKITLLTAVLFLSLGVFFPQQASAQTPEKINYQAVARDLDGNPLTGETVNVQFDIIQASAVIYRETQNLTTNQFGLFTAAIGSGTVVSGVFSTIDWGSNPTSLQVTVNGDVMPSTQLLSVPYALYAKKSLNGPTGAQGPAGIGITWLGTLASVPGSANLNDAYYNSTDGKAYIYNGTWQILAQDGSASGDDWGNQFIITSGTNISGDGTAGNPLTVTEVDGSITNEIQQLSFSTPNLTISGVGGNTVNLSGLNTNDGNGIYSGNGSLSGNTTITGGTNSLSLTSSANNAFVVDTDVLFVNGASDVVGIGTATPTQKLDVDGKIRMRAGSGTAGWIPVSDAVGTLNWTDPATISTASFWTRGAGTLYPTTITDNVGIGTVSPVYNLDIFNSTTDAMLNIESNNSAQNTMAGLRFAMGNQSITGTQYYAYAEKTDNIANGTQSDFVMRKDFSTAGGYLKFFRFDNSTSDVIINDSKTSTGAFGDFIVKNGNVGIGTASPGAKLSVFDNNATVGTILFDVKDNASKTVLYLNDNGFMGINRTTAIGSSNFVVNDNNNSGFGGMYVNVDDVNGKPFYGYALNGAPSVYTYLDGSDANKLKWVHGSTRMTLDAAGNLGIGTISPTQKLDVIGSVLAVDYLYATPKTLFLTLGESDFKVARGGAAGQIESSFGLGGVGIVSSSAANALVAPIHLPNGAVVTSVVVYYIDNSASNMTIAFQRRSLTGGLSNIDGATTSAFTTVVQSLTLGGTTIDNANNSYNIRVYSTGWPSGITKTMEIKTVKITYTIAKTD